MLSSIKYLSQWSIVRQEKSFTHAAKISYLDKADDI